MQTSSKETFDNGIDVQVIQVFCKVVVLFSFDSYECFHERKRRTKTYWPWSVSNSTLRGSCIRKSPDAYHQTVTSSSWITVWRHKPQHPTVLERRHLSCRRALKKLSSRTLGTVRSQVNQLCCSASCCHGETDFTSKFAALKLSWAPLHHPFFPSVTA